MFREIEDRLNDLLDPRGFHLEIKDEQSKLVITVFSSKGRSIQKIHRDLDVEVAAREFCALLGIEIPAPGRRHRPRGRRDTVPRGPKLPQGGKNGRA